MTTRKATIMSFAALNTLLATTQREFPIADGEGRLRGLLTREGLIQAWAATGPVTPVLDVMEGDVVTINCHAPLSEALLALQTNGRPLVGIVDDKARVVAIIALEN